MSLSVAMLVPAVAISVLCCACLALLPTAPPRVRFAIAIAGLGAWLVPWAWIRVPIESSSVPLGESLAAIAALGGTLTAPTATLPIVPLLAASLFAVGAALFVGDWLALRRCVRRWRAASLCGDALRSELPRELRHVQAEIRVVRGSSVAAASGWLKPTVWIGEAHAAASRRLILAHEMWHARKRDPVWLALIAAVRRAYWWNPLVAHLAREAVLMLESACDHRCAAALGKRGYIAALASLALDGAASPQLVATVRRASFDVARLRLLNTDLELRARHVALVALLALAGAVTAAASVVVNVPRVAAAVYSTSAALPNGTAIPSSAAIPTTPAGRALELLLRAANAGDTEVLRDYLGAYTPQELPLPFPTGTGLRVVDVLASEPLRIEYLVENRDGNVAGVGEIEVADSAIPAITSSRLRNLP